MILSGGTLKTTKGRLSGQCLDDESDDYETTRSSTTSTSKQPRSTTSEVGIPRITVYHDGMDDGSAADSLQKFHHGAENDDDGDNDDRKDQVGTTSLRRVRRNIDYMSW